MTIFTWVVIAISLAGTYLVTVKRKEGFYFWAVANVPLIYINYQAGIYAQSLLFGVYFVLAVYGIYKWREV